MPRSGCLALHGLNPNKKNSMSDSSMKEFCRLNILKNPINQPACLKNSEKLTCIDLILTNRPTYFQYKYCSLDRSLWFSFAHSNWHFKISFQKSHISTYRDCKMYDNDTFRLEIQSLCSNETNLKDFCKILFCMSLINLHSSKKYYLRANEAPFMTKELRNARMKRSRLGINFEGTNVWEIMKIVKFHATSVKKLRKAKQIYLSYLDTNEITDNRTFWRRVVPLSTKRGHKVIKLFMRKEEKIFVMTKNFVKYLTTSFQKLFPIWKYLTLEIILQRKAQVPFWPWTPQYS